MERPGRRLSRALPLESRLLQCMMTISVDLCGSLVPLGEVVALQQGSILDLRMTSDRPSNFVWMDTPYSK